MFFLKKNVSGTLVPAIAANLVWSSDRQLLQALKKRGSGTFYQDKVVGTNKVTTEPESDDLT